LGAVYLDEWLAAGPSMLRNFVLGFPGFHSTQILYVVGRKLVLDGTLNKVIEVLPTGSLRRAAYVSFIK
jgi:hypothetical protein